MIISASAIPGNEVTVGRVINELFRKGADVVYDKADMLHVSGHACQEELKIIHALTRPKFFIPLHGEQRMLQIHKRVAESMGMRPNNICVADNGSVIELTTKHMKCETTVPAGEVCRTVKSSVSSYLYKHTKRSPMIIPMVTKL